MKQYLHFIYCIVLLTGFPLTTRSQVITGFAGNGIAGYIGDGGPATAASLDSPTSVVLDPSGNVYINDQTRFCVRKVGADGIIHTVAGTGSPGTSGDGGPATAATLKGSTSIDVDADGNLYIADLFGRSIRKVDASGIITTIAGKHDSAGFSGDGGPATNAKLASPLGIAVDQYGNVFFGDATRIRKVDAAGTITTIAGTGVQAFSGDGGPATAAAISVVFDMDVDEAGNLFFCDGYNNNRIRKIDASGIITTVAGNGVPGYNGDGIMATAASINRPTGIHVAPDGEIYFTDYNNNRLRKIDNSGIITTVAGNGSVGYSGDGGPATSAMLHHPMSVVMDTAENLYVADMRNSRVRKISKVLYFVKGDEVDMGACLNAGPTPVDSLLAVKDVYIGLMDTWSLETPPVHGTAAISYATTSPGGVIVPSGLIYMPDAGYSGPDSFLVKVANTLASDIIKVLVTVDPQLLPGVITGPPYVCIGDTVTFIDTNTGGVWSSKEGLVALSPVTNGCKVSGLVPGIDTLFFTVANACGSAKTGLGFMVRALPDAGHISGVSALCLGATAPFSSSVPGGTWSTSDTGTSVNPSGVVKGLMPGLSGVIYTVHDMWCAGTSLQLVMVDTFPDAGTITGPAEVCIGSAIVLSDTLPGGLWSVSTGNASVSFGEVTGVSAGNDFVDYTVTNSCGTAVATRAISVLPVPAKPVVTETPGVLHATTGQKQYQWAKDGSDVPGATMDSLGVSEPGKYTVTVSNELGCSAASDVYDYVGCGPADLLVFPNPVHNKVSLQWCRKLSVRLYQADGRLAALFSDVTEIDLSAYPPAVYLLSVYNPNGIRVKTVKVSRL